MTASAEDIAWAKQALADGRSMSFIASVLELSERKARNAVFGLDKAQQRVFRQKIEAFGDVADREDNPRRPGRPKGKAHGQAAPDMDAAPVDRRRVLLRRRWARHWDMIWFLRSQGMAGRTLRHIYGAEALIWSVGGGIDAVIGD